MIYRVYQLAILFLYLCNLFNVLKLFLVSVCVYKYVYRFSYKFKHIVMYDVGRWFKNRTL